jgi:hypothetical protein
MGRVEIRAPKCLTMGIKHVTLDELKADLEKVTNCASAFQNIMQEVLNELQSLPKIPDGALRPIQSFPLDQ